MAALLQADELGDFVVGFDADDSGAVLAQNLCDVASGLVRADFPDIDERIADGLIDAKVVKWTVAAMVGRALAVVDDGSTRDSERIGDWSGSKSYDRGKGLYLTPQERSRLSGGSGSGGAFTVVLASSIED